MDWLTRPDVDRILEHLSADDLIEAMVPGEEAGAKMPMRAFNRAALRLGVGTDAEPATQRVRPGDLKYLMERIGEVINIDSPLSGSTEDLLASATTGAWIPEE
jgi:hypothetical protein